MLERSLTYHLASITEDGIGNANHIFEMRFGWSVRDLRVLRLVRETPGITFTILAEMTKFERSLTSRILSSLIKAGLVTRTNSADDARRFTLSATAEGEALCASADPLTTDLERLMLEPLSPDERKAFVGMAERIRTWVQSDYVSAIAKRYPEMQDRKKRPRRPSSAESHP
jgi:DNA-binding MarR family transcriptional regulator